MSGFRRCPRGASINLQEPDTSNNTNGDIQVDLKMALEPVAVPAAKLLIDVAKSASGPFVSRLSKVAALWNARHLSQHISDLDLIKSLHQPDKTVSLREIYFPVLVQQGSVRAHPENIDDFSWETTSILLRATAGHGKSLLMRRLALVELERGACVPVLVSLRGLSVETSVIDLISDEMGMLGFKDPIRVFLYLLRKGKILLLLDGFDEIHSSQKKGFLRDLDSIRRRATSSKLIISSRPETALDNLPYLQVASLVELTSDQQNEFIRHMVSDPDNRDLAIAAVSGSEFLTEVLKTPLLVILLLIAYRAESRIPDTLAEFYSLIFPTLLYRHDDTKVGMNRERQSKLGNYELRLLFEALSCLSVIEGGHSFNEAALDNLIQTAAGFAGLDADPGQIPQVREDIVRITCLIVETGYLKYEFVHKTVQEFYTASFVARSDPATILLFFNHMLSEYSFYENFTQVVKFLSELNEFAYCRFFLEELHKRLIGGDSGFTPEGLTYFLIIGGKHLADGCLEEGQVRVNIPIESYRRLLSEGLIHAVAASLEEWLKRQTDVFTWRSSISMYELIQELDAWAEVCSWLNHDEKVAEEIDRIRAPVRAVNKNVEGRRKILEDALFRYRS